MSTRATTPDKASKTETTAAATPAATTAPKIDEIGVSPVDVSKIPSMTDLVEVEGSSTTDGGFFPLKQGNMIVGNVLELTEVASQYGETKQLTLAEGGSTSAKMQKVYVIRGTARVMTQEGMSDMSGNYKVAQTERLKLAMQRYVDDPTKIVKITVIGKEPSKQKKDGTERDGAWLYDVREMRRAS